MGALATADGQPTSLYYGLKTANRDFASMAGQLQPLKSLGAYHAGTLPLGGVALPPTAPFRLEPALPTQEPQNMKPVEGFLLGYFGPAAGQPTHVVVVNLDYDHSAETALVGPGKMQTFNPGRGQWSAVGAEWLKLHLPPGGAQLVRLAQ